MPMPSSAKRKEERAKKARDDRRLAILYFPSAFGTKVSLDAHVDLVRSLTSDEADNDNLAHLEESIRVYGSALRILIKHLCTAAEKKRILDSVTTSAARGRAWRYMTTQLQTSIDSAYNIAGLVHIERATCRMHVAYRNTSMDKVPKAVPMLDFFQDTRTAYDELKEALNEHMQLCESMDEDYTSGTLNEVEIAVLTANLERVWRCRANQLIHRTIKTQLEELSTKFFEDKDAYKQAIQVLDELEEGFKASWEYVVKSEARVRVSRDYMYSTADFEAISESGEDTPDEEDAEHDQLSDGGEEAQE
ncbi:hypothetical protein SLS60_008627 [Paraconiothyrium brasiliense]|uniref:14-3-3 protein n=1 Tax=Paraconiothyrium brasiliense TaxID=300254 RepID=A0ABR3QY06_9PLEO